MADEKSGNDVAYGNRGAIRAYIDFITSRQILRSPSIVILYFVYLSKNLE